MTVAIVDHGLCNLDSIRRAIEECQGKPLITDRPDEVADADRIVLPGVGSFRDAMVRLRDKGLDVAIRDAVQKDKKLLLGICLGMQLLATSGEEGSEPGVMTPGLDLVPASVVRLVPSGDAERIPHVGWNEVVPTRAHPLFAGIPSGSDFYFVHTYRVACFDGEAELATTPYCGGFTSAVARGSVMGVQFHPEKSQKAGFRVIRNFLAMTEV